MSKLNQQSLATIDAIVAKHQGKQGPVKLMLHDVQHELGYIPFEAMEKIAQGAQTSIAEVYGVVTFYTQFTTQPKGEHVINVCMGTACYVKGSQDILDQILKLTNCKVNQTSADGKYSVDATRCLGACGLAPVVIVDGRVYGSLTKDNLTQIELFQ
ncbi:MAG: NAD(P)H-dependent oxidoreductase subunit E [Erysipelotrichaceae bacterium]